MSILSNKQLRMLGLLDNKILKCEKCRMFIGGRCKPYYTKKYNGMAIIGEAPGREEVNNIPFYGKAGKELWKVMDSVGFKREEFFIMNTINCRPTDGKRNLKPDKESIKNCRQWIRKYLKVIKPTVIMTLGNYAMGTILGKNWGILKNNATTEYSNEFECEVLRCIHPSMCIYKSNEARYMLKESMDILKTFKREENINDICKNDKVFWVQTSFI